MQCMSTYNGQLYYDPPFHETYSVDQERGIREGPWPSSSIAARPQYFSGQTLPTYSDLDLDLGYSFDPAAGGGQTDGYLPLFGVGVGVGAHAQPPIYNNANFDGIALPLPLPPPPYSVATITADPLMDQQYGGREGGRRGFCGGTRTGSSSLDDDDDRSYEEFSKYVEDDGDQDDPPIEALDESNSCMDAVPSLDDGLLYEEFSMFVKDQDDDRPIESESDSLISTTTTTTTVKAATDIKVTSSVPIVSSHQQVISNEVNNAQGLHPLPNFTITAPVASIHKQFFFGPPSAAAPTVPPSQEQLPTPPKPKSSALNSGERKTVATIGQQQDKHVMFPLKLSSIPSVINRQNNARRVDERRFTVSYGTPTWIWYFTGKPLHEIRYFAKIGRIETIVNPPNPDRGPRSRATYFTVYHLTQVWELYEPISRDSLRRFGDFVGVSKWMWVDNRLVDQVNIERDCHQLW